MSSVDKNAALDSKRLLTNTNSIKSFHESGTEYSSWAGHIFFVGVEKIHSIFETIYSDDFQLISQMMFT